MSKSKKEDELTKLILANNEAPLAWRKQQRMVELFFIVIQKYELEHKHHTEELAQLIKFQQKQNDILTKKLQGCKSHASSTRRG